MTNGLYVRMLGEPPMPPADADFAFRIEFKRGAGNPRRVFDAASDLIDGFEELDDAIAGSLDSRLKTLMILEDIEAGSIRVFLKTVLQNIDDQSLKDGEYRKAIGPALVKAKYIALEYLDKDPKIASGDADKLRDTLQNIARETDARHLPDYPPIHEAKLVASLDKLQDAKRTLGPGDKLTIEADGKVYEVDLKQSWDPSEVITVTEKTTERDSEAEIILTIRKPDMVGSSMWQFGHGDHRLSAPILDEKWLNDFHSGKVALRSGDALKCKVRFIYVFDETGTMIEQRTEILKIVELLGGGGGEQIPFFN